MMHAARILLAGVACAASLSVWMESCRPARSQTHPPVHLELRFKDGTVRKLVATNWKGMTADRIGDDRFELGIDRAAVAAMCRDACPAQFPETPGATDILALADGSRSAGTVDTIPCGTFNRCPVLQDGLAFDWPDIAYIQFAPTPSASPAAPDPAVYARLRTDCEDAGNRDRQIAGCTAVARNPDEPQAIRAVALSNRGDAYVAKGQLILALASLDEAVRLDPTYVTAWVNRGDAHAARDQPAWAIDDYTKAIGLAPGSYIHAARAEAHARLKQWDLAFADYDEALRNPGEAAAELLHGRARARLGQAKAATARAIADLDTALVRKPDFADGYETRAEVLLGLGEVKRALDDYEAVLRLDPERASAIAGRNRARALLNAAER